MRERGGRKREGDETVLKVRERERERERDERDERDERETRDERLEREILTTCTSYSEQTRIRFPQRRAGGSSRTWRL